MPYLARHPQVVYTDLDDGAVLLHGDTKYFYSLNQVGAAIWRSLGSADSVDGLIDRLRADYEVDRKQATAPVAAFVRSLEEEQLIITNQGESSGAELGERVYPQASDAAPRQNGSKRAFAAPELIKHDEPLHAVVMNPFDPKLPLAE